MNWWKRFKKWQDGECRIMHSERKKGFGPGKGDITMRQHITENHRLDENQNPTGGTTEAVGIKIDWQDGALGRGTDRREPNGAFVEGVIAAAIGRLKFYNSGKFSCRENSLAITHLEEALHWCDARTSDREARAVEGTHVA